MRTCAVLAAIVVAALAGCASDDTTVTVDDYLESLQEICRQTTAGLEELPEPPDEITVADFANEAATLLQDEADEVNELEPPDELDDDHRAFVRNTDEQATAWREVAEEPEALADVTTRIIELVGGRDDLAEEMDAPACRRSAA